MDRCEGCSIPIPTLPEDATGYELLCDNCAGALETTKGDAMSQHTSIDFSSASGGMDSASGNYVISVRHPDKPKYGMRLLDVHNGCAYYNTEMVGDQVLRAVNAHEALVEALRECAKAAQIHLDCVAGVVNGTIPKSKLGDVLDGLQISKDKMQTALSRAEGR